MKSAKIRLGFRKSRVRRKIAGSVSRPRLSIYRGHRNIYAQLIDDDKGHTLVFVSTLSAELRDKLKIRDTVPAAKAVGDLVAKKALEKGIKKVVFDRGGHVYTGRVKAFADAARQAGLEF